MGTTQTNQTANTAAAWERAMEEIRKRDRADEDAIKDVQNAGLMEEQERKEKEAAQQERERELHQLKLLFEEGILNPQKHLQGRLEAWKRFKRKMSLSPEFNDAFKELFQRKP